MYSVNGVALDNSALGWEFLAPSTPLADYTRRRGVVSLPGQDGVTAGMPSTVESPELTLVVSVPRTGRSTLLAVFGDRGVLTVTGVSGTEVAYETVGNTTSDFGAAIGFVHVSVRVRLPGAYWRDSSTTTLSAVTLSSNTQVVSGGFSGLSAPIQDAIVRVKGAVGANLIVQDHGGAFFTYTGTLTSSQWLRFHADTGRAYVTPSDAWIGGTEVSGAVDYGGPRGVFEFTPYWSGDPTVRALRYTVFSGGRSGSPTVEVRARGAYLL